MIQSSRLGSSMKGKTLRECRPASEGMPLNDPRTAALRELHEETGYGSGKAGEGNAEVEDVSAVLVKDPG